MDNKVRPHERCIAELFVLVKHIKAKNKFDAKRKPMFVEKQNGVLVLSDCVLTK